MPKIYDTGLTALLPFRRKDFYALKNPSAMVRIEPANLGSRGEYDNHWTTGVDWSIESLPSNPARRPGFDFRAFEVIIHNNVSTDMIYAIEC